MSTGSTEGYNAEVFVAQGSTRFENAGHTKLYVNHIGQHLASTYADASTIPMGVLAVTNSSTNISVALGSPKLGYQTRIWIVGATSSGIHTFTAAAGVITGVPGTTGGNQVNVENSGFLDIYCPSTTVYIIGGSAAGSSDITVSS